ncbi:MAG: hypothetical protein ACRC2T_02335 [Thermoguttaceae bacterium]
MKRINLTEEKLEKMIFGNKWRSRLIGTALLVGSVFFWPITFAVIFFFAQLPKLACELFEMPEIIGIVLFYIIFVSSIITIIYLGFRRDAGVFDSYATGENPFTDLLGARNIGSSLVGARFAIMWEVILIAPIATREGIHFLFGEKHGKTVEIVPIAVRLYKELCKRDNWVTLDEKQTQLESAALLLHKHDLIRLNRNQFGKLEVCAPGDHF